MTNNKLTDEFLENLITTRIYPLDFGYVKVGDDLVAMARELQERRKADEQRSSAFAGMVEDYETKLAELRTKLRERRKADNAEPVMYQDRARPTFGDNQSWSYWEECSAETYAKNLQFVEKPDSAGWLYEVRKLYAEPQPLSNAEHEELEQYRKNYQWRKQLGEGEGP